MTTASNLVSHSTRPIGTAANNLLALDSTAKIPAVDGSQLTGLTTGQIAGLALLGVGQVWSSPTRAAGTTYTNTTGKPIMVRKNPSGTNAVWTIGGVNLSGGQTGSTGYNWVDTAIVPVGATYSANFGSWQELS